MVQSFDNQVMFGHREWAILADNNKPTPVGPDNKPLVDKPVQKELREPSDVDEDTKDDYGIAGYMGDDEDVQQAQYNVMSLIDDKIGGLNIEIDRITRELDIFVQKNRNDIDELDKELKTELCVPFLMDKCDGEQTYEGCSACARYYHEKGELPEDCLGDKSQLVQNHCTYSSPNYGTDNMGEDNSRRVRLDELENESAGKCDDLGHFDCSSIITQNLNLFQKSPDRFCLWDTPGLTTYSYPDQTNLNDTSLKCRNLCFAHGDEGECTKTDHCLWYENGGTGQCLEKICENRNGYDECTNNYGKEEKNDLCGVALNNTVIDPPAETYFQKWRKWVGIDSVLPQYKNGRRTCLMRNGKEKIMESGGVKHYKPQSREDYCNSDLDKNPEIPGNIKDPMYVGKLNHEDWNDEIFGITNTNNTPTEPYIKTPYDFNPISSPPNVPYCRTAKNIGRDKIELGGIKLPQSYHCRGEDDPTDNISYYYDVENLEQPYKDNFNPCLDGPDSQNDSYIASPGDINEDSNEDINGDAALDNKADGRTTVDKAKNLHCRREGMSAEAEYVQGNYKKAADTCENYKEGGTCYYGYDVSDVPGNTDSDGNFIPSKTDQPPGCYSFPSKDGGKQKLEGGNKFFSAYSKYCSPSPLVDGSTIKRTQCLEDHCHKYENDEQICNKVNYDEDIITDSVIFKSETNEFDFLKEGTNICATVEDECSLSGNTNHIITNFRTYHDFVTNFNAAVTAYNSDDSGFAGVWDAFWRSGLALTVGVFLGYGVLFLTSAPPQAAALAPGDDWWTQLKKLPALGRTKFQPLVDIRAGGAAFGGQAGWLGGRELNEKWDISFVLLLYAVTGLMVVIRYIDNTQMDTLTAADEIKKSIDAITPEGKISTQMDQIRNVITKIKGPGNNNFQDQISKINKIKEIYTISAKADTDYLPWSISTLANPTQDRAADLENSLKTNGPSSGGSSSHYSDPIIIFLMGLILPLLFNLITPKKNEGLLKEGRMGENTKQLVVMVSFVSVFLFASLYFFGIFIGKDQTASSALEDGYTIPMVYNDSLGLPLDKPVNLKNIYFCGQSHETNEVLQQTIFEYTKFKSQPVNADFGKLYKYGDTMVSTYKTNIILVVIYSVYLFVLIIFLIVYFRAQSKANAAFTAVVGGGAAAVAAAAAAGKKYFGSLDFLWIGQISSGWTVIIPLFAVVIILFAVCSIIAIVGFSYYWDGGDGDGTPAFKINTGKNAADKISFFDYDIIKEILNIDAEKDDAKFLSPGELYKKIIGYTFPDNVESGGDCLNSKGFCKSDTFREKVPGNIPSENWTPGPQTCINQDIWNDKVDTLANLPHTGMADFYKKQPILNTLIKNNDTTDNYFDKEVLGDVDLIKYGKALDDYMGDLMIVVVVFCILFGISTIVSVGSIIWLAKNGVFKLEDIVAPAAALALAAGNPAPAADTMTPAAVMRLCLLIIVIVLSFISLICAVSSYDEYTNVGTLKNNMYTIVRGRFPFWKGEGDCGDKEKCYIHVEKDNKRYIKAIDLAQDQADLLEYECNKLGGCTSSQFTESSKFSICLDNGFTKADADAVESGNTFSSQECVSRKNIFTEPNPGVYKDVAGWSGVTAGTSGDKMSDYLDINKLTLDRQDIPFYSSFGDMALPILVIIAFVSLILIMVVTKKNDGTTKKYFNAPAAASVILIVLSGLYFGYMMNFEQTTFYKSDKASLSVEGGTNLNVTKFAIFENDNRYAIYIVYAVILLVTLGFYIFPNS